MNIPKNPKKGMCVGCKRPCSADVFICYYCADLEKEMACLNCAKEPEIHGVELKKCMRCHISRYCSKACQKKDWKFHKLYCRDLQLVLIRDKEKK